MSVRDFVAPRLKAGRVPYGRIVILIQLIVAMSFVGYTLTKKSVRLPLVSGEPFTIEVEFADAQGLDEADGPGAAVAGSPVGRVSTVREENGRAIATLVLEDDVRGKIFSDATARVRPASALQNLIVNIDAGERTDDPLEEGERIVADRTQGFVALDELTSLFDADTQAMTQILIQEAAGALRGREPQLRRSLAQLGELSETATPLAEALADRRRLLGRAVDNADVVFATLADRRRALAEAVDSGSRTLAVTAGREPELAAATRLLAPVLADTRTALEATGRIARPLAPALAQITPVADRLPEVARRLDALQGTADGFLDETDALTRQAGRPIELLVQGTRSLRGKTRGVFDEVDTLRLQARLTDRFKGGVVQFADLWSGGLSVNDNGGAYAQIDNVAFEPARPENLGFPPSPSPRRPGTQLSTMLAEALELSCRDGQDAACIWRFSDPNLPEIGGGA